MHRRMRAGGREEEAIEALRGIALDSPHPEVRAAATRAIQRQQNDLTLKPQP